MIKTNSKMQDFVFHNYEIEIAHDSDGDVFFQVGRGLEEITTLNFTKEEAKTLAYLLLAYAESIEE